MALSKEEILDAISEMSVMDVVDLVKPVSYTHLRAHETQ